MNLELKRGSVLGKRVCPLVVYISENLSTVLFQEIPSAVPSPSAVPQSLRPPHNSGVFCALGVSDFESSVMTRSSAASGSPSCLAFIAHFPRAQGEMQLEGKGAVLPQVLVALLGGPLCP